MQESEPGAADRAVDASATDAREDARGAAREGAPRAGLALAGLCATALVEARFRRLTDVARAALADGAAPGIGGERAPGASLPGAAAADPHAVAEWIAAGRAIEPLVACLVAGGLVGALAVATLGTTQDAGQVGARRTRERIAATVFAALAAAAALVLPVAPGDPKLDLANAPVASFGLAALGSACATWLAAPLFLALFRPRWTVVLTAVCAALPLAHVVQVLGRGDAPRHPVIETTAWLVETTDGVAVRGEVAATDFAGVRAAAGASIATTGDVAAGDDDPGEAWRAWLVTGSGASSERASTAQGALHLDAGPAPARFVGARRVRASHRASARSSPEAPNLITIAVDGLRTDDVAALVHAGAAPAAVQAMAEAGLFFPDVIAPTPDPARNEAAWLSGAHPLDVGRAPGGQGELGEDDALADGTLPAASSADGMRVAALREGPPRAGTLDGFAEVACGLGDRLVPRARRFVAAHAEERFHLHLSFTRLDLKANWHRGADARIFPRPDDDPGFDELARVADERVRERTTRAPRVADPDPIDPAWTAHLAALHAERTRALLDDVGALLDELDRMDLTRRTIVVIAGTSGVALGEHDHLGYGRDLFLGSVRVPVLVRGPGVARNERRAGPRALVDLAAAIRAALRVHALPDPTPVAWFDAERATPILLSAPDATWNGTRGREVHGLVSGALLVHWCAQAEGDIGALPGYGPWRMYRTDTKDGRAVDLALVPRYAAELEGARAALSAALERAATRRAAAESELAPWARIASAPDARSGGPRTTSDAGGLDGDRFDADRSDVDRSGGGDVR